MLRIISEIVNDGEVLMNLCSSVHDMLILVTNPTWLVIQSLQPARDLGEYFVGPLTGFYILQIVCLQQLCGMFCEQQ